MLDNNQPNFEEFLRHLHNMLQHTEQSEDIPHGIILQSPIGDIIVELGEQSINLLVNGTLVVTMDCQVEAERVVITTHNYTHQNENVEYEQIIDLSQPKQPKDAIGLNEFVSKLQDNHQLIVLDIATSQEKDAYILTKSLNTDNAHGSFLIWRAPNRGVVDLPLYTSANCISSQSTLVSGMKMFDDICRL